MTDGVAWLLGLIGGFLASLWPALNPDYYLGDAWNYYR